MFATLEDVAQEAGCSLATVSRAINGSSLVSEDVRAKVSAAVQSTGYKPRRRRGHSVNRNAAGAGGGLGLPVVNVLFYRSEPFETLKPTAKGMRVGALHAFHPDDLQSALFRQSNNFEQGLMEGLLAACSHFQLKAGIISTDNFKDPRLLEEVGGTEHGGLIIGGIYPEGLDEFLEKCRQRVVLLDMLHGGEPDVVTSDNMAGVRLSVRHLLELGHRDIGFAGPHVNPSYYERYLGFLAAMTEGGCAVKDKWVMRSAGSIADATRAMEPMLKAKDRPTALVACSDYMAIAAMEAARQCGLEVPGDLSVVGFDDVAVAQRTRPALTTVRVPVQELGWRAVEMLLPLPQQGGAGGRGAGGGAVARAHHARGAVVRVPVELVVRESCAAPRKGGGR